MIPLKSINNPISSNGDNIIFQKKEKSKKQKNINLSNLLVCDDSTMIERLSFNQAIHTTQRNTKTSKGSSRKKSFSKGDRFKILNQQLYTEQDFNSTLYKTTEDDFLPSQRLDSGERFQTESRLSQNQVRPFSQDINRFHLKTEQDFAQYRSNDNSQSPPLMNSFINNTPQNRDKPYYILPQKDKENLDSIQKLQLFIKPSFLKQRDYLSIDARSRRQSFGEINKSIRTQGDNTLTLYQTNNLDDDQYIQRKSSNSCNGKYYIDQTLQSLPVGNSQTIQFQEKGIRSFTPSIISTSTNAATLTLNKSQTKGKKNQTPSKSQTPNQSTYKKKLKILQKKENKCPKQIDIIPFSVTSSYNKNNPTRISKNLDLKVIQILGAYDQQGFGNFIFNKKQFKQYLKNLNFKTPQEEQQMIKYMFIYFKEWQKKINKNINMIKLQLFSIKVEDLEEESVDIQKYIKKKANQAKRIKKCICVLLSYTKSKRDYRKLKQINQKCSEYDSLLKTINVIHTLKLRVEGYLINKLSSNTPANSRQQTPSQQRSLYSKNYINQQNNQLQNEQDNNINLDSNQKRVRTFSNDSVCRINNDFTQQDQLDQTRIMNENTDVDINLPKKNSNIPTYIFTNTFYENQTNRRQSRGNQIDQSDANHEIRYSRPNSGSNNAYEKRKSLDNQLQVLQQSEIADPKKEKQTPSRNITPLRRIRSDKQDETEYQQISQFRSNSLSQNKNTEPTDQNTEQSVINFQKDIVNVKTLKPLSLNYEDDSQKNTLNQVSVDNMIKNGSTQTNYQESSFLMSNNCSFKQSTKEGVSIGLVNQYTQDVGISDETPKRKCINGIIPEIAKGKNKSYLKYESLERVIKKTIAEKKMSIKHKSIFQNYIDSIKIPLEDLQRQGEDVQHIFEIFNQLMLQFEEKIQDHAKNCEDLNKWDILLQYLQDFSLLIDESVRLGSELMKLSKSKALPQIVTNRAVVYFQEAQEKYREVSSKVKDSLKELVNRMWELIEEGIHLNSTDSQYENIFKFMANIRDCVKKSQVNDYQNKEKLAMIDETAHSLNELYKISFNIQGMVTNKQTILIDSLTCSFVKDVKDQSNQFKTIYRNMMDKLDKIINSDNQQQTINRESLSQPSNFRKSNNHSIQTLTPIIEKESNKRDEENDVLFGVSLVERQCEEIEDLFDIHNWFIQNAQDIDNLTIFEDPKQILNSYSPNEDGKRKFFNETSIGISILLQLKENVEDINDISSNSNLTNIIKNVSIASEKYTKISNIAFAVAELCNLQHYVSQSHLKQQNQNNAEQSVDQNSQINTIQNIYDTVDKLKAKNKTQFENNLWFERFLNRFINGTLYFDFFLFDYPFLCENMHIILTEYSNRNKHSVPNSDLFFNHKDMILNKINIARKNKNLCEDIVPPIQSKIDFVEQRVNFAKSLFGFNHTILPNGSLLCKILEVFFERIVHFKPLNKLSEQFEKLRAFMLQGFDIVYKEKEILCSKKFKNQSSPENTDDDNIKTKQKQYTLHRSQYPILKNGQSDHKIKEINLNTDQIQKTSKKNIKSSQNSHRIEIQDICVTIQKDDSICMNKQPINVNSQTAVKSQKIRSHTPNFSGTKKMSALKELRFEQEQNQSPKKNNAHRNKNFQKFNGRVNYYENIIQEAENLCKHCSLFIPSREDEKTNHKLDGEFMQNFSLQSYEEFMQLCSRYLLAKKDKEQKVKWISQYNEEQSIFQQKHAFIQKFLLTPEQSTQENLVEYSKHINQIFHKNGPIFYKYDFQVFQSYLQLFIDTPSTNFHVIITLEHDPSAVLYQGYLENQKFQTTLPINDIYAYVKMTLISKDMPQQLNEKQNQIKAKNGIEDNQESINNIQEINNLIQDDKPFLRHKSCHTYLMRAQKITQLRISNLNFNLREQELFKIFYRSNIPQQQQDKQSGKIKKQPILEVYAIINESQVVFRRRNISSERNIFMTQYNSSIQEWTIVQDQQKQINIREPQVIDFYVKISNVEEGSFYIYDKNNYYSIKSSLLLKCKILTIQYNFKFTLLHYY